MEIQDYLKFEYLNFSSFSFIIRSPILKNYEYFLYFISIYQSLILDKIFSIHVLVVSPIGRPTHVTLNALRIVAHEIINYVCIFSDVSVTVFTIVRNCIKTAIN